MDYRTIMPLPHNTYERRSFPRARSLAPLSRQGWIVGAMAVICALGGGSSQTDVLSLFYLRPMLILGIAAIWVMGGAVRNNGQDRWPLWLLGLFAASMAIQLVPLPPELWLALPGRARFAGAATIGGAAQPWQPISLAPMYTVNSILALIPAFAGLYGGLALAADDRVRMINTVLFIGLASALLGAIQIGGGEIAYTYAQTSPGLPVGLFANRNHQAVLLALCIPLLALWAGRPATGKLVRVRPWVAAGLVLSLLVMLLITGSRAGLAIGAVSSLSMVYAVPIPSGAKRRRYRLGLALGAAIILGMAFLMAMVSGRALAVERLFALTASADEQRLNELPTLLHMIGEFMPFGIGYGAFDPVFRVFEADSALQYTYFNHAHNDAIELLLTGGVLAGILLLLLLFYIVKNIVNEFMQFNSSHNIRSIQVKVPALTTIIILLIASLADYPLRTPLLGFVFAICLAMISDDKNAEPVAAYQSVTGNEPVLVNDAMHG